MTIQLMTQTCDVVRYGSVGEDDLGRPIPGEVSRVTYRCRIEPASSSEGNPDTSSLTVDVYRGFFPADAIITAADKIECDGNLFEVDGSPANMVGYHTVMYVQARLRLITEVTP